MRMACGKESERPLSRFPLRGKAGAGGFPPRRRHAARQPKPLARIMLAAPPTRGLPPPCASPAGLQRRCTLRRKPDISLANKTGQLDVLPTLGELCRVRDMEVEVRGFLFFWFLSEKCNRSPRACGRRGLLTEAVSDSTPVLYPFEIVRPNNERKRTEVLLETFIRKQLRLKAHTVTKVEETDEFMIVSIDRLGRRLLRCGVCGQRCREVHSVRKERDWRDLSLRKLPLKLRYRPPSRRVPTVRCARGGLSVGGTLGASDDSAVQCRRHLSAGTELAGHGTPVWSELEERSDDCEAGRAIWLEKPCAAAHACNWNR
jgi:hypothetical protein